MVRSFLKVYNQIKLSAGRISTSTNFGRADRNVKLLGKYFKSDYEKKIDEFLKVAPEMENVKMKDVVLPEFKTVFYPQEMISLRDYFKEMAKRAGEFRDNQPAYRVMVVFYMFHLMFLSKLIEVLLGTEAAYKNSDPDYVAGRLELRDIGIDKKVLKFYSNMKPLREKNIDDWLKLKVSVAEENYILSAFKRMFHIFGF